MSALTANPSRTSAAARFEEVEEAAGSWLAERASAWGRRTGKHAVHVTLFVITVLMRKGTVVPLAHSVADAFADSLGGIPALLLNTWASSYDAIWTHLLAAVGVR